ncbi:MULTISPECIES: acyl-CoA dehydrogenase family protein [Parafrankia]|uniref:Acyl-CoA dehydrogenase n=1 Tax=Parafrankia soli TaxID=2599596 RepID=A0A1S1RBJ0_9ACTN|nr:MULTISPECIES: acyl-CoA dehydrogenase family protein [Parafrankia]OHV42134.1 acyl-CoA dehydrogenase [Parafrankia soli]TCJ35810.1 acyl-CoA dehydrogenase [Parafrankia sp. BMG5.11]CAI7978515.1 Acyl-CoA dehydrogenase [Frankia sp. Hr75.2]SQD93494.1 Acyl-CoA dehydrogenase domain protein [Parafrankia sp. Ea1.12]
MLLELDPDQEVLREATARYLTDRVPTETIRRLRNDASGFEADYWRAGAELGWTSLLVSEENGGGSISGAGLVDLTVAAHEFGLRAAPGPLVPTNVVAAALSAVGGAAHEAVLAGLLEGTAIASWCYGEPAPNDRLGTVELTCRVEGDEIVLDGVKRPVESAGVAQFLLVTGRSEAGLTQVLVPTDTPGLTVEPLRTVDLTRRFATVRFDGVRVPASALVGELGGAAEQVERQLQLALVILCAESVGSMQAAFDMTVQWAFERYSFGRPLASYQELKHRFADMKSWLEAAHAISDTAASAVDAESPDAPELVSAAKAFIGEYGTELLQDCVQIHGGIGVTFEHDLHLFLRRVVLDRALYGTPAEHRQRIAGVVEHLKERA